MRATDKLPGWFAKTKIGRQLVQESERDLLTERQGHIDAIKSLREELAEKVPPLREAVETCHTRWQKLSRELMLKRSTLDGVEARRRQARSALARADLDAAERELAHAVHPIDRQICQHEAALRRSAPTVIGEYLKTLGATFSTLRARASDTREHRAYSIDSDRREVVRRFSNARSRSARLDALRAAQSEVESWRLQVLTEAEMEQRYQALCDALPEITYESVAAAPPPKILPVVKKERGALTA